MVKEKRQGGLKGFMERAGSSFLSAGMFAKDTGTWLGQMAGKLGFIVATTSMVVLMPLLFEIGRETQVRKDPKLSQIIILLQNTY